MSDPTLYLDEDVNPMLADILNQRGFSVQTTKGCSMLGQSDEAQLDFANQKGYVFLPTTLPISISWPGNTAEKGKNTQELFWLPNWNFLRYCEPRFAFFRNGMRKVLKTKSFGYIRI